MQTYIESETNYKGILLKLIQYNKCHVLRIWFVVEVVVNKLNFPYLLKI